MAVNTIRLTPGIDVETTPILNGSGWNAGSNIRFFEGLPQKIGGWLRLNQDPIIGTARGTHSWADVSGIPYIAIGTEQRLQLFAFGLIYDITPIRLVDDLTTPFATTSGSNVITVTDVGNGVNVGDWVFVAIYTAIGGLILNGFYQVDTVIDPDTYTFLAAANATATVSPGGIVPKFTTTNTSATVKITLTKHGLTTSDQFVIQVDISVGGVDFFKGEIYAVDSVIDANNFNIIGNMAASSSTNAFENGGDVQIQYLIQNGYVSTTLLSGYGIGPYGAGPYGIGSTTTGATAPLRIWFLDNWGGDLIGNFNGSPIYVWVPPVSFNNVAIAVDTVNFPAARQPPTLVHCSFVAMPERILIAAGADAYGTGVLDPNLVRWCNVDDFTDWQASATNQAGSFRIPSGSRIVGGIQAPQFAVLWTDVDMWLMSYLGFPLVFGFQKVAVGVDLLAPNAAGLYQSVVYWIASNGFYAFDGNTVRIIPCPVFDILWLNLNREQKDKIFCAVNSWFNEVSWWFPSATGDGEIDSRITLNVRENTWTYDSPATFVRTCWFDDNAFGGPYGTDLDGLIQQHEVGYDADGLAMIASVASGFAAISEGTAYTYIDRIMSDFVINGGVAPNNRVFVEVAVKDFPSQDAFTYGPFEWTPLGPPYNIVRARGRFVQITVSSTDPGVFWRLGGIHYQGSQAGRR